jgi:hypothetical protein
MILTDVPVATGNYGASTTVATSALTGNAIMCAEYGTGSVKGHVVVCGPDPELRGDSLLDWSIWDNWMMGGTQTNSIGAWSLLGRMINYAATGTPTAPTVTEHANPTGRKVAILCSLDIFGSGGVYPMYLPSLFRAVEASGNIPLTIRARDINYYYGWDKLTTDNFDAFILPEAWYDYPGVGESAEALDINSTGYDDDPASPTFGKGWGAMSITDFAAAGGGVMGIGENSAGYLSTDYWTHGAHWNRYTYTHPAPVFGGSFFLRYQDWSTWLRPVTTDESVVGTLNSGVGIKSFNSDWPAFYGLDFTASLADSGATAVSTYDNTPVARGMDDGNEVAAVRCLYPVDGDPAAKTAGHVLLSGPDFNILNGSNYDWTTWDNYYWGTNIKWTNSDGSKPWSVISAALNHWVACPTPTVACNAPATWKRADVTVTITAKDSNGPGIASTQYRKLGDTEWTDTDANTFVVAATPDTHENDGVNTYEYRALDTAGNASAVRTCAVKIDTTAPVLSDDAPTDWMSTDVTVTITPVETGSGVTLIQYRKSIASDPWHTAIGGQFVVLASSDHSNDGAKAYRYRAIDAAGNVSATGVCIVRINTM